jgi:hypothetical protein
MPPSPAYRVARMAPLETTVSANFLTLSGPVADLEPGDVVLFCSDTLCTCASES